MTKNRFPAFILIILICSTILVLSGYYLGTRSSSSQVGYVTSLFSQDGREYLTVDYVQWLTQTDGTCRSYPDSDPAIPECNPNGYLIANDDTLTQTLQVADNALIDFSEFRDVGLEWRDHRPLTSPYLTMAEFQDIFSGADSSISWLSDAVYWIRTTGDVVTRIKYQYQP